MSIVYCFDSVVLFQRMILEFLSLEATRRVIKTMDKLAGIEKIKVTNSKGLGDWCIRLFSFIGINEWDISMSLSLHLSCTETLHGAQYKHYNYEIHTYYNFPDGNICS